MRTPVPMQRPWRLSLLAIAVACLTGCGGKPEAEAPASTDLRDPADVLISGGLLFDGSDAPGVQADIAISGDRILAVGPELSLRFKAARTIDATGKIVAPGFIDPHTHPETYIRSEDPAMRRTLPWLHQGVSTIFIGIDGGGTPDVADDRAWFEKQGVGVNLGAYVGMAPVRMRVLGESARAPDADELKQMQQLVAKGMCEGAFGLSSGLFYAPQGFFSTDEVVSIAQEAAKRGGIYDTHHRDESSYGLGLMASLEEVLTIGKRAGMPVHIAHIKALGTDVHGKSVDLIARIEQAHAEGQKVTADQYPWLASGTNLWSALLPHWAVDGGRAALLARLEQPADLDRIRADMRRNLAIRGGAEALLLTGAGYTWTGKTLQQAAQDLGMDPIDAALRIISEGGVEGGKRAHAAASFNMDRADVDRLMQQPWVITASDGGDGHPRQYASFPEKYRRFVHDDKVIDLQAFIHRSTGLTAKTLGIQERGQLIQGMFADVVVFDPERFAPKATYLDPAQLSEGVDYLFVNGTAMIDGGEATDALPGRVLRHTPTPGSCP